LASFDFSIISCLQSIAVDLLPALLDSFAVPPYCGEEVLPDLEAHDINAAEGEEDSVSSLPSSLVPSFLFVNILLTFVFPIIIALLLGFTT